MNDRPPMSFGGMMAFAAAMALRDGLSPYPHREHAKPKPKPKPTGPTNKRAKVKAARKAAKRNRP